MLIIAQWKTGCNITCNSCLTDWGSFCYLCKKQGEVSLLPKIGPKKKKPKKVQKPKPPNKKTSKSYKLRVVLFARDGNKCLKCGSKTNLTIDHVIPKSKGGSNSIDNYQTLCKCCNGIKGSTYADYRNKFIPVDL